MTDNANKNIKAVLFVTCLVDIFFPYVGENMVKILNRLGVDVVFPEDQTCCGQPAFNTGYRQDARVLAERFVSVFSNHLSDNSYIISPSGSCTSMVKVYYNELIKGDHGMMDKLSSVVKKTYEFTSFLTDVLNVEDVGAKYSGKVTYHDSCHSLRELRIADPPRNLLNAVEGLELVESDMHDACCGFGGTFSVKHPSVSTAMVEEKIESIMKTGADAVVSNDMGCLMQLGGIISRRKLPLKVLHITDILAEV